MSLRLNWRVWLECRDCGREFKVVEPNPSKERMPDGSRIIMLTVDDACPACRNLRVVSSGNDAPPF